MKNKILLVLVCLWIWGGLQGQNFDLEIVVKNKSNTTLVEFANIFIAPCDCGGVTDENGLFSIQLAKEEYQIITSCIGFQPDTAMIVLDANKTFNISLIPTGYQLEKVTVTGQNTRQNIERTIMGVQQLNAQKLKMLPTAVGEVDVLRSLTMLAGVGSAGEASNGLSVRGGSLDQNLILLDYAPIFNPTHLFGLFSVFTPEAVGGVELYRSNMPSRYGGRISSVVDVKIKNPDAEKLILSGGIGFASMRLAVETPIIKNKLTALVSTRMFFNDFIFSRFNQLKNTRANFIDGTVKLKFQANDRNTFFLTGFYSHDFYQLDITSKINSITASSNQYDYSTLNGTLNWLHSIGKHTLLRSTFVLSDYQPKILFPQENSDRVISFESRIQYRSLQSELSKTLNPEWQFSIGLQADQTTLSPGSLFPDGIESIEAIDLLDENNFELSAFSNVEWTPSEKLSMSLGLRYTRFLLMGAYEAAQYDDLESEEITSIISYEKGEVVKSYGGLEPRFGLRWKITENTSLKGSYSLTRQYLQNIFNSTSPLPSSRWKTSDPIIQPQTGHTYSLGVYQNLKDNKIAVSMEGYYRTIDNVLDYKPGADFFLQEFIEKDVLQGTGRTYGLELSFEKPEGDINGWFNYTWSKSTRRFEAREIGNRINNNNRFNSDFDRPHVFNGTINFKLNEYNTYGFNFIYQTGRPYTIPNASFLVNNVPVPVFLERNNSRLPAYHRLDFSWRVHNITTKGKRWIGDWILTLYNIYNRRNVYNRFFGGRPTGQTISRGPIASYELSIFNSLLVSLTYSFKFQ